MNIRFLQARPTKLAIGIFFSLSILALGLPCNCMEAPPSNVEQIINSKNNSGEPKEKVHSCHSDSENSSTNKTKNSEKKDADQHSNCCCTNGGYYINVESFSPALVTQSIKSIHDIPLFITSLFSFLGVTILDSESIRGSPYNLTDTFSIKTFLSLLQRWLI